MQTGGVYAPINAYLIGAASIGLGLHALLRPREEYARFGLPLPGRHACAGSGGLPDPKDEGGRPPPRDQGEEVSPLMYVKGIREITYGLALAGLQYEGQSAAGVTIVAGVMALAGLGDGIVVWCLGRRDEHKFLGHWAVGFLGLGGWAGWRAFRAYGEWAAFHALHS